MKKGTIMVLLLAAAVITHAADKYAPPGGNSLAGELQWLAVQTACTGQYNNAQEGNYTISDPEDNYQPGDIREYLTKLNGSRTRTATFYGRCFDYAQAAYDDIAAYRSHYEDRGMQKGGWYIAGTDNNSRQITLYDPSAREQATVRKNGVYLKERSQQNIQAHGSATHHAWLWVYGNDGTIYWIDPTWTDNSGYVWWGVVRNGREEQTYPLENLCQVRIFNAASSASLSSGSANMNNGDKGWGITDHSRAVTLNMNYASAYVIRGVAYYHQGEYGQAIADYSQAIRLDPNYAGAYSNRGSAYYEKGDYDRAIADFSQAIRLDPNLAPAYNNRGSAYYEKGIYGRAIADFSRAVTLAPNEKSYKNNLELAGRQGR